MPEKYNFSSSTTATGKKEQADGTVILFEHGVLDKSAFSGRWVADDVDIDHSAYNTTFTLPFLTIDAPLVSFQSPYSGQIGLAPPY